MGRGLPRAAFVVSRLDLGCLGHRVLDFCAGRQHLQGLVTRSSTSTCSSTAGIFFTQACDFLTLSLPSLPHVLENFPFDVSISNAYQDKVRVLQPPHLPVASYLSPQQKITTAVI